MDRIKDVDELYDLVSDVYGYKAQMLYLNSETKEVGCVLYNSFLLKCNIDDRYNRFGAGIALSDSYVPFITQFLGKQCSLSSDPEDIASDLLMIDQYCRLRLPDKFLEAFDKAHGQSFKE